MDHLSRRMAKELTPSIARFFFFLEAISHNPCQLAQLFYETLTPSKTIDYRYKAKRPEGRQKSIRVERKRKTRNFALVF